MISRSSFGLSAVFAAALIASSAAQAATTTFFANEDAGGVITAGSAAVARQQDFLNYLTSSQTENFAGVALGAQLSTSVFGGAGTIEQPLPAVDALGGRVSNVTAGGRFNTSPPGAGRWWESDSGFSLKLNDLTSSFGFFGTDAGDFNGTLSIDLTDSTTGAVQRDVFRDENGNPADFSITGRPSGSLFFFGLSDDTFKFDTITFRLNQVSVNPANWDVLGFDDIIIGSRTTGGTVPEPTSLALVALSLGVLAASRRRKTQA